MTDENPPELPEDWEAEVRKALQIKKPKGGWPVPPEDEEEDDPEDSSRLR